MPKKRPSAPSRLRPGSDVTPTPVRPISRSEFSRRAGKSKSRISEDSRPGGLLAPACVLGGDIDLAHPAVAAWALRRHVDPARLESPAPRAEAAPEDGAATPSLAGEYDELTLRKRRAEVEKLELRNARDQGKVVATEHVRVLVYGYLEALHLRLLRDGATTLAESLLSAAKAGATREALVAQIQSRIGQDLARAKRSAFSGLTAAVRATKKGELPDDIAEAGDNAEARVNIARRSALQAARVELRGAAPRVAKAALHFVLRGAVDEGELESVVATMLEAAVDQAGRPTHGDEPA